LSSFFSLTDLFFWTVPSLSAIRPFHLSHSCIKTCQSGIKDKSRTASGKFGLNIWNRPRVNSKILTKLACFYPTGKPSPPHILRCQGFAVVHYSRTLGRLGSPRQAGILGAASSTFATLGLTKDKFPFVKTFHFKP